MFIDSRQLDIAFAPLGAMQTVPNIALLTECRHLSDSAAINMSLLRSAGAAGDDQVISVFAADCLHSGGVKCL